MNNEQWRYYNPVDVIFGNDFTDAVASLGRLKNVLVITTAGFTKRGVASRLLSSIDAHNVSVFDKVTPNPDIDLLDNIKNDFSSGNFSTIVALGGGSVIDTAKVLSVVLRLDIRNPLNKIFREGGNIHLERYADVVAIPTTSGTGAECTPFATVWDPLHNMKHSLNNEIIYPAKAVLDPLLVISLPYQETLFTGLDAISHSMESLWNVNSNPVSQMYSLSSLEIINNLFEKLLSDPGNISLRSAMMKASFFSGLAISQTQTAISHSISYPLTYLFGVPHGLACSFTLPAVADLLISRGMLRPDVSAVIERTADLIRNLQLRKSLTEYVQREAIFGIIDEMFNPSRMKNFMMKIDRADFEKILNKSI